MTVFLSFTSFAKLCLTLDVLDLRGRSKQSWHNKHKLIKLIFAQGLWPSVLVLSTSWSWWCVGSRRPESPRSVHEFYSLKDSQINKVHTSSHEITIKPYKSSNYENIDKTTTSDSLNNELWWLWCPDEHLRCWKNQDYSFLLCSILVKYDLIVRYEARVNALGASSFNR